MMTTQIKMVGAVLLAISLLLPMSSCTHYETVSGERVYISEGEAVPDSVIQVVEYSYALEDNDPTDFGFWLALVAFLWPIPFVALFLREPGKKVVLALRIMEPLLVAGSLLLVHMLGTLFGDPASGAFLAGGALLLYLGAAIWENIAAYRAWRET